jgi:hypothetical protein
MSIGMQLSVICAGGRREEHARRFAEGSDRPLFGKYVMTIQQQACTFWPARQDR